MLQFLPVFNGRTIAVRASGKLSHEDYQAFLPELEKQLKDIGKASILFELDDFLGWELDAAKDDFKFAMKHLDNIERFAVVGDKAWERWMVLMVKPFMPTGKVRYFNRESLQKAWDWLREPEKVEVAAEQIIPYEKITVAIDFSPSSKHAVKRALELAKLYGIKLTLLHVIEEVHPYPTYYGDSITEYFYDERLVKEKNEELVSLAQKEMDQFICSLDTAIEVKSEVLSGNIKTTILSYLEAQDADLVIFGTKKKTGVAKLMGSTPRYIQNHVRCEMLVIPFFDSVGFEES